MVVEVCSFSNCFQTLQFILYNVAYLSHFRIIILYSFYNAGRNHGRIPCVEDNDCPKKTLPLVMKCIDHHCQYRMIVED